MLLQMALNSVKNRKNIWLNILLNIYLCNIINYHCEKNNDNLVEKSVVCEGYAKAFKYILDDLIGLSVEENGEMLGKVEEIVYNGINILLSVVGDKSFYIPTSGDFIKKVDLEKGIIETEGAKGLML